MRNPYPCLSIGLFALAIAGGCSSETAADSVPSGPATGTTTASSGAGVTGGAAAQSSSATGAGGTGGASTGGAMPGGRCPEGITSDPDLQQALPQATVDVTMPTQTGKTITVAAGDDLQAALDTAALGDVIEIEAGATFQGPFKLPNLTGTGTLVIRSNATASLPAEGNRITLADASSMPTLLASTANDPAVDTALGAHHIRFIGIRFTTPAYVTALVDLGTDAPDVSQMPHDIVFDRCLFQGHPDEGTRRAIALNSGATAVIDSYFADFKEAGGDSQAICGWQGTGPYLIVNNYLEGAAENVLFGGSDPALQDVVPSDITFCHNLVSKPLTWLGTSWTVKNLFELKNARRVLAAGNVFENNWLMGQVGYAIVFTPRNQDGSAPWSTVEDVTFVRNVVRHTSSGVNILSTDNDHPSQPTARLLVAHNLIEDLDTATLGGQGRAFQVIQGGATGKNIKCAHNTAPSIDNAFLSVGDVAPIFEQFDFVDNVLAHGTYGAFGGGVGEGTVALDTYFTSWVFQGNVIFAGGTANKYPTGNAFPATAADVGFVDAASNDWALAPSSPYAGTATDGTNPGADMTLVKAAIAGVE